MGINLVGTQEEPRQLFRDRYRELERTTRNWQYAAAGTTVIALMLAAGIIYLAARSRYIPYVVTLDRQGFALTAPGATSVAEPLLGQNRIIRYEIAGFIRDAREVVGDPLAETEILNRVKARSGNATLHYLDHWYNDNGHVHDPFKLAKDKRVTVDIDSILKLSAETYQVRWTERDWSLAGDPEGESHWECVLEAALNPPAEISATFINPLGFTVSEISWTEQRQ